MQIGTEGRRLSRLHPETKETGNDTAQHIAAPGLCERRAAALVSISLSALRIRYDTLIRLETERDTVVFTIILRNFTRFTEYLRNFMLREPGHLTGMRRKNPGTLSERQERRTPRNQIQSIRIRNERNSAVPKRLSHECRRIL